MAPEFSQNSSAAAGALQAAFREEERVGEATVSTLRLWALAILYLNELVNYHALQAWGWDFHARVSALAGAGACFAGGTWALLHFTTWSHSWFKYVTSTLDVVMVTALLLAGAGSASPSFVLYYVIIGTSNLRYSTALTVYTTGLCGAAYLALHLWAGTDTPSPVAVVIYVLGMVVTGLLSGYVVARLKVLVRRLVDNLLCRQRVEGALARYVSYQVAEKILQQVGSLDELTEERRYVTVLIADIRGFTALCSRRSPEEVVRLLNDYFEKIVGVVFALDGTLDKFIGDAVLVVFGAPTDQPDSELRAVECAWRMQETVATGNAERRGRGEEEIRIGIGINAGDVVAGNVGSRQRMEYTVLGDVVNLTQRLSAAARPGQTLLSESVHARVASRVEARALEPLRVKGKPEPVNAYELLGVKPALATADSGARMEAAKL